MLAPEPLGLVSIYVIMSFIKHYGGSAMTNFEHLTSKELSQAISETREALKRGRELLNFVAANKVTLGIEKVAEAMPKAMEKLEGELASLVEELEKK